MTSEFSEPEGSLRMIAEYFIPAANNDDETMEAFAKRRVGTEFSKSCSTPWLPVYMRRSIEDEHQELFCKGL
jgi:protoporphyrinogen oxidase